MGSSFSTSSTFSTSSSSHESISSSIGSPSESRINFSRYVYGSTTSTTPPKKQQYHREYIIRTPKGDTTMYSTENNNNDYNYRNENTSRFGPNSTTNNNNTTFSRKQILLNGWNLTKRVAVNAFSQQFNYANNSSEALITKQDKQNTNKWRNGSIKNERNTNLGERRNTTNYGWSEDCFNQKPPLRSSNCGRSPPPAYYYDTTFGNRNNSLHNNIFDECGNNLSTQKCDPRLRNSSVYEFSLENQITKISRKKSSTKNEANDSGYCNWTSMEEEEMENQSKNTKNFTNPFSLENNEDEFSNKLRLDHQDLINNNNHLNIVKFNNTYSSPEVKPKTPISPVHKAHAPPNPSTNRLLSTFSSIINNNNSHFKRHGSDKLKKANHNRNVSTDARIERILPTSLSSQRISCDDRPINSSKANSSSNRRPLSWSTANGSKNSPPSPKFMATLASPLPSNLDLINVEERHHCDTHYMTDLPPPPLPSTIMTMDIPRHSSSTHLSTIASVSSSCLSKGRRAVVQASTSELLRGLGHFLQLKCPSIRHFESSHVVMWLRTVDRSLMLQGWQDVAFINPANLVFVYMLIRDRLLAQKMDPYSSSSFPTTLEELQCLVLTCLYVSYSYMGNEISYPMKPFISETGNRVEFWNNCVGIINCNSAAMLRLNASSNFFFEIFTELKNYSVDC